MDNPKVDAAWDALAFGTKRLTAVRDALAELAPEMGRVAREAGALLSERDADVLSAASTLLAALNQSTWPNIENWAYRIDFERGVICRRRRGNPGDLRARARRGNEAANKVQDLILDHDWPPEAAVEKVARDSKLLASEVWEQLAILRGRKSHPAGTYIAFVKKRRRSNSAN